MENSPLARLPPELRNNVYELVLVRREPIGLQPTVSEDGQFKAIVVPPADAHLIALTATCKQVRAESSQLVYARNIFRAINWGPSHDYTQYLGALTSQIGESHATAIRTVYINLGMVVPGNRDLMRMLTAAKNIRTRQQLMPDCAFELHFYVSNRPDVNLIELVLDCRGREPMETSRERSIQEIEGWGQRRREEAAALPGWRGQRLLSGVASTVRELKDMLKKVCASFDGAEW